MTRVIFIPGNYNSSTNENWFPSVKQELESHGLTVTSPTNYPDPQLARAAFWLPFIHEELKPDENTILVGHSSGALAAMRYAEQHKILASVLVGVCHNDLGIETERVSGYYEQPWQWEKQKSNQKWTVIFASQDDPWIPIEQPRFVQHNLNCEYHEFTNQGHFGGDYVKSTFPELSLAIIRNLQGRA